MTASGPRTSTDVYSDLGEAPQYEFDFVLSNATGGHMRRMAYNGDHEAFRASARTFVERVIRPAEARFIAQRGIDADIWRAAGAQGLLGLNVAEKYGGSAAGDYRFNAVLLEELAASSAALASSLSVHFDVVAPYLCELTTEEQRQRWLPRFCSGELITAIALTEPSGGSDFAALRTSAVTRGSDWVLNGSKTFITNGLGAELVIVAARTDPTARTRGITLFAVEGGMPGFVRGRKLDKVGQPEADTAELFFSDLLVPAENVIGDVGEGFSYTMQRLAQERVGAAVASTAHATAVLDETLEWARERTAFGQPIGSFQHNKFVLADLVTRLDVTRAFVDQAVGAHARGELSATDAAKSKYWSAEVQNHVLDACVQLYGGYGFMREYRVARAWMDARVTRIWAGTNEIMKEVIGRDLGL